MYNCSTRLLIALPENAQEAAHLRRMIVQGQFRWLRRPQFAGTSTARSDSHSTCRHGQEFRQPLPPV